MGNVKKPTRKGTIMSSIVAPAQSIMAWRDINVITTQLRTIIDDMGDTGGNDQGLGSFNAPLARAIASMRAERAWIDVRPRETSRSRYRD